MFALQSCADKVARGGGIQKYIYTLIDVDEE